MRLMHQVVIHHTASPRARTTVADVRRWHVEERGWRDIGYHFLVGADGRPQRGRPVDEQGAHVRGHNADTIGVCVIGAFSTEAPTEAQVVGLAGVLAALCVLYRIDPREGIVAHRDLAATDCPGDALYARMDEIRQRVLSDLEALDL